MFPLFQKIFTSRKEECSMTKYKYLSAMAAYMSELIAIKHSAGISTKSIEYALKEFDRFFIENHIVPRDLTESVYVKWRESRINDSDVTIYNKCSYWRQLMKLISRSGINCFIPRNPKCLHSNFEPYIFTNEQIQEIFKHADGLRMFDKHMTCTMFSIPAILRLLYSTGLRISEVLSIKNEDLYLNEDYIHIRKSKNNRERIVYMNQSLKSCLQTYLFYRNKMPLSGIDDPQRELFIKADGSRINQQSVYVYFKKILEKCGIPHIGGNHGPRVHDLRHTYAVHSLVKMVNLKMDLYVCLPILSASLGHRDVATTEKYVRLTQAMFPDLLQQCFQQNIIIPNIEEYDNNY